MARWAVLILAVAGIVALLVLPASRPQSAPPLERRVIGESVEGRPLEVACTDGGIASVLLVGGIHTGHEVNSVEVVEGFVALAEAQELDMPQSLRLCLLPNVNPDGLAQDIHTNANGVDLNRNWPTADWMPSAFHPTTGRVSGGDEPLSEPETQALHDFIVETAPAVVVSWHCCAGLVEANDVPPAAEWARVFASAAELSYIDEWTAYEITGGFIRALEEIGIPGMDVELTVAGDAPIAAHRAAVEALLAAVAQSGGQ